MILGLIRLVSIKLSYNVLTYINYSWHVIPDGIDRHQGYEEATYTPFVGERHGREYVGTIFIWRGKEIMTSIQVSEMHLQHCKGNMFSVFFCFFLFVLQCSFTIQ